MVLSSSMVRAESIYDNPFFFASRQAIFISIGFIIFCFFLLIPSDFLRKFDWLLLIYLLSCLSHYFFRELVLRSTEDEMDKVWTNQYPAI
ncbi:MAG: hypothetical protein Ct9H90mP6_03000 [Gammaproteobacteria bacterium]|nr:MAG: hypothetical protein Ct9H90mP6_03000 [Gammaproteobacteria bacterium]